MLDIEFAFDAKLLLTADQISRQRIRIPVLSFMFRQWLLITIIKITEL